ncbi:MAG: polysaccharide deacetylase family protein [Hyphomicrobiaceae bacterium]|nr:polysaccharide deacetylase family protein [Hyphomicrobiaceae bacterium]
MRAVGAVWACLLASAVAALPAAAQADEACDPSKGIGVARTADVDTRGGPWFGEPFGDPDFLAPGEVVLTFDDGPLPGSTSVILATLAAECTKATFFVVGQMAAAHPDLVKAIADQGHTVGGHTWSHPNLRRLAPAIARAQIEIGFAEAEKAAGQPIAPFFRYPYLSSTPATVAYLRGRDIAQFAVDIDSSDWLIRSAQRMIQRVMTKLEARGRGIILLHDIHPSTALAIRGLLARLKEKGYRIVHLRPAAPVQTLVVSELRVRAVARLTRFSERPRHVHAKVEETDWTRNWPF